MRVRLRNDDGFLLVELLAAMVIITISLLALLAAYDQTTFSLRAGAKGSSAALIADNQLELYASLKYANIGLDATSLTSAKNSDANYSTDEAALPGGATGDYTLSSACSSAQCKPVQTLTGGDGNSYKLETFIRLSANPNAPNGVTWNEKVVTVIVRNMSVSSHPKVVTLQTAFDPGPSS